MTVVSLQWRENARTFESVERLGITPHPLVACGQKVLVCLQFDGEGGEDVP